MMTLKNTCISVSICLITVGSITQWCKLPIDNTFFWWTAYVFSLATFAFIRPKQYGVKIISVFLLLVCISALYGAFVQAENYWDWKSLVRNLLTFMLPISVLTFASPKVLKVTLDRYFLCAPFLLLILGLFLSSDAFGRLLVPYSIISLFYPALKRRNLLPLVIAFLVVVVLGFQSRSNVVKFALCLVLGTTLFLSRYKRLLSVVYKMLHIFFLCIPAVLGILAATGSFNVFDIEDLLGLEGELTLEDDQTASGESSVLNDTRSFIYLEEFNSAVKYGYLIQGRSIARGYESDFFGAEMDEDSGNFRGERYSCEVAVMNIFNYFGIIGVLVYFLVFLLASIPALYKSNNVFIKLVGVYVAFRWTFAWIEDFTRFDLNYLFLWIMMAMCFSPWFRKMTDKEFIQWVRSIRVLPIIVTENRKPYEG